MTTTQFQRIEALLKQWEKRAESYDVEVDEACQIGQCATEMGELLQSFSEDRVEKSVEELRIDVAAMVMVCKSLERFQDQNNKDMARLSRFLDWQKGKMDIEKGNVAYSEFQHKERIKKLEADLLNPPPEPKKRWKAWWKRSR